MPNFDIVKQNKSALMIAKTIKANFYAMKETKTNIN
jgi:hypothetical protein